MFMTIHINDVYHNILLSIIIITARQRWALHQFIIYSRHTMPILQSAFQSVVPYWFKAPIAGPAPGPHMRRPGCNGAVCYCNHQGAGVCGAGIDSVITTSHASFYKKKTSTQLHLQAQDYCNSCVSHGSHVTLLLASIILFPIAWSN